MSFSSVVKEELVNIVPSGRKLRISELSGLLAYIAKVGADGKSVTIETENSFAIRKCFTLLSKTYNINNDFLETRMSSDKQVVLDETVAPAQEIIEDVNPIKIINSNDTEMKRAFLRGVFIATGFVGEPTKGYHLEFAQSSASEAAVLAKLLMSFDVETHMAQRKKRYVLYIKDSESVSDVLSICEASKSMMDFVNEKIVRDVRNTLNRRVNCEAANLIKSVNAANSQIDDIIYIRDHVGLDALPDQLREMAIVRLEFPEEPLSKLGEHLDPPVGKSGVNHRLRKLGEYAESIR